MGLRSTNHDARRHSDASPVHHSAGGAHALPGPQHSRLAPRSRRPSNAARLQVRGPLMQVRDKVTMTSEVGRGHQGAQARPRSPCGGCDGPAEGRQGRWAGLRTAALPVPAHLLLQENAGPCAPRGTWGHCGHCSPFQLPRDLGSCRGINKLWFFVFFFLTRPSWSSTHAPCSPSMSSLQCVYVYIQGVFINT